MYPLPAHKQRLQRIVPLTPEQVESLLGHRKELGVFPKQYMRMGINGSKLPSIYSTNSLFKQPASKHKEVIANVPKELADKSLVRYFLNFPANEGFLDKQGYWIGANKCMTIVAWSLSDNNEFWASEDIPDTATLEKKIQIGNVVTLDGVTEIITANNIDRWQLAKGATFQTKPAKHTFNKGEGFAMSLSLLHEVRVQGDARDWFCLGLVPGCSVWSTVK